MFLHELEAAASQLPVAELTAFTRWFEAYPADDGDRRIETDIKIGRLDEAGLRAGTDFETGQYKTL